MDMKGTAIVQSVIPRIIITAMLIVIIRSIITTVQRDVRSAGGRSIQKFSSAETR